MSRSGFSDDCDDQWQFILCRGHVASAIRGKRGQAFLRELIEALDALPEKRLIAHDLRMVPPAFIPPEIARPQVCAIGAVGVKRGIALEALDPEDYVAIAGTFGIAPVMVQEIEWMNDDAHWGVTPEARWQNMRDWAASQLKKPAKPDPTP